MTNAQTKAIERVKAMTQSLLFTDNYEVKEFTIQECEFFVSVVIETGMKNDEGTYASIFARERVHIFIGKRGGITYPVHTNKGQVRRRLKSCESLLTVSLAQRM